MGRRPHAIFDKAVGGEHLADGPRVEAVLEPPAPGGLLPRRPLTPGGSVSGDFAAWIV
jgi:hypothetical protein